MKVKLHVPLNHVQTAAGMPWMETPTRVPVQKATLVPTVVSLQRLSFLSI